MRPPARCSRAGEAPGAHPRCPQPVTLRRRSDKDRPMLAATLEDVPCDLCGQDDPAHLMTKNDYRVVRCRGCSLVYVTPRPRMAALTAIYDADTFFEHQTTRAADESWKPVAEERA